MAGPFQTLPVGSDVWKNAANNLLGPLLPVNHRLPETLRHLEALQKNLPHFSAVWNHPLNGSADREAIWTARKLAHASALGLDVSNPLAWLRGDALPFAADRPAGQWLEMANHIEQGVSASGTNWPEMGERAREFSAALPALLLSEHMDRHADDIARAMMHRSEGKIEGIDPSKCESDLKMGVHAMADCLIGLAPYPSWSAWWDESISPSLGSHSIELRDTVYGTLPDILAEQCPGPLVAALKEGMS